MGKYVITTPRLQLRPMAMSDLDALAAMYADAETMQYIGYGEVIDRETTKLGLEKRVAEYQSKGYGQFTLELHDGTFIGRTGLMDWLIDGVPEREVGYILARPHWGHGYATEGARAVRDYARDVHGLNRLISLILPQNAGSIRVAEKNGMMLEKITTIPHTGRRVCCYARNWSET
ncbi:MAG: GNAT family N-acetyltransferase [bacterium]